MATPDNLMGLGMQHFLASRIGVQVVLVSAEGATAASAKQINGKPGIYVITSGNSGVALPLLGGDTPTGGALLADPIAIANISGSALVLFAANNAKGSAVTLFGRGASTAGTTGVSIGTGITAYCTPITVSIWLFNASI